MARVQLRTSVSLNTESHLKLQALAGRRGLALSAWLEEQIAERASVEGISIRPEDIERANDGKRRAAAERRRTAEAREERAEQARREAFG